MELLQSIRLFKSVFDNVYLDHVGLSHALPLAVHLEDTIKAHTIFVTGLSPKLDFRFWI